MKSLIVAFALLVSFNAHASTQYLKSCSSEDIRLEVDAEVFAGIGDLFGRLFHSDTLKVGEKGEQVVRESYQIVYNTARIQELKVYRIFNSLSPDLNTPALSRLIESSTYFIIYGERGYSGGEAVVQNKKTGKVHKLQKCTFVRIS